MQVVFSQPVDQSEHEDGKTSSVVLRMSEISLNIFRVKYLNGWSCGCPSEWDGRAWGSAEVFKCRPKRLDSRAVKVKEMEQHVLCKDNTRLDNQETVGWNLVTEEVIKSTLMQWGKLYWMENWTWTSYEYLTSYETTTWLVQRTQPPIKRIILCNIYINILLDLLQKCYQWRWVLKFLQQWLQRLRSSGDVTGSLVV